MKMKTLTYWIADNVSGSANYSIRAATRRECEATRQKWGAVGYGPPRKVSVQYRDALDLVDKCLGGDPGYFEAKAK